MSDEHLTVDGTLIQAWAWQKSFRPKDGDGDGDGPDFGGQKRSNEMHQSTTDPDAWLYKKSYGKELRLSCYLGHVLAENRNGQIAAARWPPPLRRAQPAAAAAAARQPDPARPSAAVRLKHG